MFTLSKSLADALCVVIACGFIDKMTPVRGKSSNNYTDFITGDETEQERYRRLKDALSELGIAVTFHAPPDKEKTPFIMGKARNLVPETINGLQADMKGWADKLEAIVNRDGKHLRGAYLGGYDDASKTEVLGVSDLYLYPAKYRTNLAAEEHEHQVRKEQTIEKAYEGAREVTNAVIEYLMKKDRPRCVRYLPGEPAEIREPYRTNSLFASVHGMTRAIAYAPRLSDTKVVHFELALGKDTNKVASCIPCSLFMAVVGDTATFTHLGRGDNWNFPKPPDEKKDKAEWTCYHAVKTAWANYIMECYRQGEAKLARDPRLSGWFLASTELSRDKIPDVFLESLTYESSFLNKFSSVLGFDTD